MTIEAPPSRPAKSFPTAAVTREAAQALIAAALTAAKSIAPSPAVRGLLASAAMAVTTATAAGPAMSIGIEAAVAVTDATGALKAFERTDGAPFLAAEVAINKAWTAASYGYPTHVWNAYVADPNVAPLAYLPRMMAVGGGYPLVDDGKLVGGIGISGGNVQQDQDAAEAALRALGFDVPV